VLHSGIQVKRQSSATTIHTNFRIFAAFSGKPDRKEEDIDAREEAECKTGNGDRNDREIMIR
jgi:hypothetical protein